MGRVFIYHHFAHFPEVYSTEEFLVVEDKLLGQTWGVDVLEDTIPKAVEVLLQRFRKEWSTIGGWIDASQLQTMVMQAQAGQQVLQLQLFGSRLMVYFLSYDRKQQLQTIVMELQVIEALHKIIGSIKRSGMTYFGREVVLADAVNDDCLAYFRLRGWYYDMDRRILDIDYSNKAARLQKKKPHLTEKQKRRNIRINRKNMTPPGIRADEQFAKRKRQPMPAVISIYQGKHPLLYTIPEFRALPAVAMNGCDKLYFIGPVREAAVILNWFTRVGSLGQWLLQHDGLWLRFIWDDLLLHIRIRQGIIDIRVVEIDRKTLAFLRSFEQAVQAYPAPLRIHAITTAKQRKYLERDRECQFVIPLELMLQEWIR